jgi:hypothetical protein
MVPTDQSLKALAWALVQLLEPSMGEIDRLAAAKLAERFKSGTVSLYDPRTKRTPDTVNRSALNLRFAHLPTGDLPNGSVVELIAWCQRKTGKELAATQRENLQKALESRVLVIHGRTRCREGDAGRFDSADPSS